MSKIQAIRYKSFLDVLETEVVRQIHADTLLVLDRAGVNMPHKKVLAALSQAGARVSGTRVFIGEEVLNRALSLCPPCYTLGARDATQALHIDGRTGYLTLDGSGLSVMDPDKGVIRPSTLDDLREATRVADALPQIAFMWPVVAARDCPERVQPLWELYAQIENTTKHIQAMTAVTGLTARGSVEIARAVAGGTDQLRHNPVISSFLCSTSPLSYAYDALDALLVYAEAGIPTGFMTMQIGCATAPSTLYGNLVLGNAEILAGITALQAIAPGTPTFYGSCATVMDLRTGAATCGGPEDFVLQSAACQMARFYHIPSNVGTFATGAKTGGWRCGAENALSGMASALAGADMMCGAGLLDGARVFSFEQLVRDCEIFEMIRRYVQGVDPDPEAALVICRVGTQGHFLAQKHTRQHMRGLWQPSLINRQSGSDNAREFADSIRKNHRALPLEEGLPEEIERIIRTYERQA